MIGVLSVVGIYPLMRIWLSGLAWQAGPYSSDYALMIVGTYATLSVLLILAARNPLANLSLIWFTSRLHLSNLQAFRGVAFG